MKIALLDLNHMTRGVHTNTVPLGLGLISRYLQKTVNHPLEIRMFKDTQKALDAFDSFKPDILGISQYSWNTQLNLHIAGIVKEYYPSCLVIAGGPNIDSFESRSIDFFRKYPFVDICVSYDGEIPCAEVVKRLLAGESAENILAVPPAGAYTFDSKKERIIISKEKPPRLHSLDIFGAIYADGVFDELLSDGFHPFLQTQRGCPFSCAFCHAGEEYYSRIIFLSADIFRQDMEYLGKRFANRHDVVLYLANTNMSLFKEDFAIAEIIRDIQSKCGWPRFINVNSGRDTKKLLKMLSIIKFRPGIALQTLTAKVLKNVKRKNIPFKDYVSFQHTCLKKISEVSGTELILCLPGETKTTFLSTLKKVLNSGVQNIVIFTLMHLKGTLLSSPDYVEKYSYIIRHRVVPRQFSLLKGRKILDTEEVIVGTSTMAFEDYLELRNLSFIITIFFNSNELIPLRRILIEYGLDIAEWIFNIQIRIPAYPELSALFKGFIRETKEELFISREALVEYFEKIENFKGLCCGHLGDNLLTKYKCIALSDHYITLLELAVTEAGKLLSIHLGKKKANELLKDIALYLSSRKVTEIFKNPDTISNKELVLNYDVPGWLSSLESNSLLEDFYGRFKYRIEFDEDIQRMAKDFVKINKDFDLSLQVLYRDGIIKDFWPKWSLIGDNLFTGREVE